MDSFSEVGNMADYGATATALRSAPAAGASNPGSVRSPEPLLDSAATWLRELPDEVRPQCLPREFPRIVNKLCELWKRPARCDVYFNQLILDDRGGRAGFSPPVMKELGTLAAYYADAAYPSRHSVWVETRKR